MFAILNQPTAALWLGSWAPCGSAGAFESTSQLNSGQRELCLLMSSKHLWCPKNILEETGPRGQTPIRAPRAFLCPSSPSPSLQDTGLSFIPPPTVSFAFVTCIVSLLGLCSHVQIKQQLLHSALWTNTRTKKPCEIKLCLCGLLLRCCAPVCQSLTCPKSHLSFIVMCDNQNT